MGKRMLWGRLAKHGDVDVPGREKNLIGESRKEVKSKKKLVCVSLKHKCLLHSIVRKGLSLFTVSISIQGTAGIVLGMLPACAWETAEDAASV